jgi:thiol:disulfide interchange protein DsbC
MKLTTLLMFFLTALVANVETQAQTPVTAVAPSLQQVGVAAPPSSSKDVPVKTRHLVAKKNTKAHRKAHRKTPAQTEAFIRKTILASLGSGAKLDSITKTPYGGLYEVRMGNEIIYTDEQAKYIVIGEVINLTGTINYTRQRTDELNRVNFSDLPLDAAVKYVKGDGKRVIAIFEDPNCGYCKKFRRVLQDVDNLTVYTFMYNILAEDSVAKSKDIWCSADRNKGWDDWMLNAKAAPTAPANCVHPHEKVLALGKKLRVTGTPTVIFADGSRLPGMVDIKALEEKFASLKPAAAKAPAPLLK